MNKMGGFARSRKTEVMRRTGIGCNEEVGSIAKKKEF